MPAVTLAVEAVLPAEAAAPAFAEPAAGTAESAVCLGAVGSALTSLVSDFAGAAGSLAFVASGGGSGNVSGGGSVAGVTSGGAATVAFSAGTAGIASIGFGASTGSG